MSQLLHGVPWALMIDSYCFIVYFYLKQKIFLQKKGRIGYSSLSITFSGILENLANNLKMKRLCLLASLATAFLNSHLTPQPTF